MLLNIGAIIAGIFLLPIGLGKVPLSDEPARNAFLIHQNRNFFLWLGAISIIVGILRMLM